MDSNDNKELWKKLYDQAMMKKFKGDREAYNAFNHAKAVKAGNAAVASGAAYKNGFASNKKRASEAGKKGAAARWAKVKKNKKDVV